MDYIHLTAPCGLDCFNCPRYLANDNEKIRQQIAAKTGADPSEIACQGCRNENGAPSFQGRTEPCNVFRCTTEKNLSLCSQCDDFPCDHLHPYADLANVVPHNTKVFNLCLIKKMGHEKWAHDKAASVKDVYYNNKWKI